MSTLAFLLTVFLLFHGNLQLLAQKANLKKKDIQMQTFFILLSLFLLSRMTTRHFFLPTYLPTYLPTRLSPSSARCSTSLLNIMYLSPVPLSSTPFPLFGRTQPPISIFCHPLALFCFQCFYSVILYERLSFSSIPQRTQVESIMGAS